MGHKFVKVEKVEPTCTEPGTEAYWKCSVCGKEVEDSPSGIKHRDHCTCGALMTGVVE